jgi:hypothetical protein
MNERMGQGEFTVMVVGVCVGTPAIFGIVIWALVSAFKQRQQRLSALAGWAQRRGLTWCPDDQATLAAAQRFRFASHGRRASSFWVARGGTPEQHVFFFPWANVFEATLTIGSSRHHVTLADVCVLWTPRSSAPEFVLRRRTNSTDLLSGRIDLSGALFNGHAVTFPDDPAFSKDWVLQGDEAAVRAFFTPERRRLVSSLRVFVVEQRETSLAVIAGGNGEPEQLEALERAARALRASWD